MSEQTPELQDVIDRFASRDVSELETLKGQIDTLLNASQKAISGLDDDIAFHRMEIVSLESKQKKLVDEAWPYSLMKLAIEEALSQKAQS